MCLLVDAREKLSQSERAHTLCERLQKEGLRAAVKPLPVGDFLWVAVPRRQTSGEGEDEMIELASCLVLDCIVERKQVGDFLSTLKNSRHYHSQKVSLCTLSANTNPTLTLEPHPSPPPPLPFTAPLLSPPLSASSHHSLRLSLPASLCCSRLTPPLFFTSSPPIPLPPHSSV